ncbi:ADM_collapsed_G0026270.mRNA.1.CDS.1 [Saccharomyces cerevisiae]|nr:ADM_collapsed_G0026270.mRNA.1.CDS.1 [Saccharomyces cerevisiae]
MTFSSQKKENGGPHPVAIVVFFGNGEPFHVSLSVEMVFVLLLSSTRIHEVVFLYVINFNTPLVLG